MKNIEVIREIVNNMTETRFNTIVKAESDYWELDSKVSRNGYKRLVYNLSKEGLTVDEWFAWCDD
jgi:hypothetical protein